MGEKNPHPGGRPFRGNDKDILSLPHGAYAGNIPTRDIVAMEWALNGLRHGEVSLTVVVRDGRFQYSRLSKVITRSGCDDE